MPDFGIATACTQYTIQPAELGRWAETHGFESLWFAEHTHIPTSRKTPYPMGELPEYAKEGFDPFIGLRQLSFPDDCVEFATSRQWNFIVI
jgi:alkanesulfonate monooxygenase SsuD/methylene tetrahydromethanopterin reductase-like flavin-dependent oxidoreductase (luciferase family)